jgi:hypothetical protein
MGNAPGSPQPPAVPGQAEATPQKSNGVVKFVLSCIHHGVLATLESEEEALQAAAEHLYEQHAAAADAKSASLEVQVSQVKSFGIADLEGYRKPKE